ncbi:MAG: sensor histidine kinase [Pseudomonadota bacterium]
MTVDLRHCIGRLVAASTTWVVVFAMTAMALAERIDMGVSPPSLQRLTLGLHSLYGAATLALCVRRQVDTWSYILLAGQLLAALALGVLLPYDWLQIYTIMWLAMLPSFAPSARLGWLAFGALIALWWLIGEVRWHDDSTLRNVLLFGTFHLFALISARETLAARRAREAADKANRELRSTRELLAESSRAGERARIARDLHDLLGHHLTALSINLQVAVRTAEGEQRSRLEECHALARLLLSDVRDTVGALRSEVGLDLTQALQALTEHTPGLTVHLDIDTSFAVDDVATASAVLRCVQEALTNTLRHANARKCWVSLRREGEQIHLQVRDDGRVDDPLLPGNGLKGMAERASHLAGSLTFARHGDSLQLDLRLPLIGATLT